MIRIGVYSENRGLQSVLSSALGKEFEVVLKPNEDRIDQMLSAGECDMVVLDLDPNHLLLKKRIDCSKRSRSKTAYEQPRLRFFRCFHPFFARS